MIHYKSIRNSNVSISSAYWNKLGFCDSPNGIAFLNFKSETIHWTESIFFDSSFLNSSISL